jgi:hypothetical protein
VNALAGTNTLSGDPASLTVMESAVGGYVEPPTIPPGMTIAEYRRARADRARPTGVRRLVGAVRGALDEARGAELQGGCCAV